MPLTVAGIAVVLFLVLLTWPRFPGSFAASGDTNESITSVTQTIELTARDGAFRRDGTSNPTLRISTDQVVRLRFQNTQNGVYHAIAVPALEKHSGTVKWGQSADLIIRFDEPGTYKYTCPMHTPVMTGVIKVTKASYPTVSRK